MAPVSCEVCVYLKGSDKYSGAECPKCGALFNSENFTNDESLCRDPAHFIKNYDVPRKFIFNGDCFVNKSKFDVYATNIGFMNNCTNYRATVDLMSARMIYDLYGISHDELCELREPLNAYIMNNKYEPVAVSVRVYKLFVCTDRVVQIPNVIVNYLMARQHHEILKHHHV